MNELVGHPGEMSSLRTDFLALVLVVLFSLCLFALTIPICNTPPLESMEMRSEYHGVGGISWLKLGLSVCEDSFCFRA